MLTYRLPNKYSEKGPAPTPQARHNNTMVKHTWLIYQTYNKDYGLFKHTKCTSSTVNSCKSYIKPRSWPLSALATFPIKTTCRPQFGSFPPSSIRAASFSTRQHNRQLLRERCNMNELLLALGKALHLWAIILKNITSYYKRLEDQLDHGH